MGFDTIEINLVLELEMVNLTQAPHTYYFLYDVIFLLIILMQLSLTFPLKSVMWLPSLD